MATGDPNLYANFSGGVNLQAAPYLLDESQCRDARNVHSTVIGSITKRPGMVAFMTDTTPFLDAAYPVHSLFPANVTTKALLAVGKQQGASSDRLVKVSTAGAVTSLKTGLTQGKRWEFVQGPTSGGQGPIYGVNGTDAAIYWDGSSSSTGLWTSSTGTAVPYACPILVYHLDRFWLTGDPSYPGRIWGTGTTSGLPDPRVFNTDYIDDVDPNDGQPITGLGKCGAYLLVFKAHKMYALSSAYSGVYRTVHSSIGCSAHRSIVETAQGTMFLSEDVGVCVTDGTEVTPISDNILPLLREAAETNAVNFPKASATYFRDSYWLSIPYTDNDPDILLEYQLKTKSWWIHSPGISQFALLDPSGTPKLYASNAQTKQVNLAFVDGTFDDVGETYEDCYWVGPFWPWGQPHLNKRVSQFRADGKGDWTTSAATAFSEDYAVLEEKVWEVQDGGELFGGSGTFGGVSDVFGPDAGITERRFYTPDQGWGRSWSLRVDSVNPSPFELFSVSGFVRPRSD